MKIFHTENGKEAVYVQMNDIMELNQRDYIGIPASIYMKVFNGIVIVNDSNRFNFVRFDEEHEVKFFRDLGFIIDYDEYKDLTDEELDGKFKEMATKVNEIVDRWNTMTAEERKKNSNLLQEYENLKYMITFLSEIYAIYTIKHNKRTMPFPDFVKLPKKPKKKTVFNIFKKE